MTTPILEQKAGYKLVPHQKLYTEVLLSVVHAARPSVNGTEVSEQGGVTS